VIRDVKKQIWLQVAIFFAIVIVIFTTVRIGLMLTIVMPELHRPSQQKKSINGEKNLLMMTTRLWRSSNCVFKGRASVDEATLDKEWQSYIH
jgi:hypothetical protein